MGDNSKTKMKRNLPFSTRIHQIQRLKMFHRSLRKRLLSQNHSLKKMNWSFKGGLRAEEETSQQKRSWKKSRKTKSEDKSWASRVSL
jgi:hypothetical protein